MSTAKKQIGPQEIWGKRPRYGYEPTVQAYIGSLPAGEMGVEFFASEEPSTYIGDVEARWYLSQLSPKSARYSKKEECAAIDVKVTKSVYCYESKQI
jgi:hypothetical protein